MALVLALLPDHDSAERLRAALAGDCVRPRVAQLAFAASWSDLLRQADSHPPDVVAFDPADGVEGCAELRARHPAVAMLAYGRLDGDCDRARLAELGVCEMVIRGQDDEPRALRELVCTMLSRRFADGVIDRLVDLFPQSLHPLLRYLLMNPCPSLNAERAARSQGRDPRTLRAMLREAGLPPLNRLIVWTRLLYAAHLLAGTGRATAQVAREAGYPTTTAFRAQVQRYAGIPARELRGACGVERLLECFRTACVASAENEATAKAER